MDHKQLRAFLTVAETGNMTRAAEMLHVVQSAVSRQIQLLEEDLGVKLFQRERHGIALTGAGKSLQGYARRVMLELDRARAELSGSETEVAGIVTVGLLPSTCDVLATPLVAAVAREYPKVHLRLAIAYIETAQQWLEKGDVDFAVLYGVENLPHIDATPLVTEPLWVVGPATAKLRKARPVPLASLVDMPMVLPAGPHGVRAMLDYACAMANVKLQSVVETNAMSVQKALVLGGQGYTVLPPVSFAKELASRELTGAPITAPDISRTLQLALPANRTLGRHVRCVVDILLRCIHEAVASKRWPEARWVAAEE